MKKSFFGVFVAAVVLSALAVANASANSTPFNMDLTSLGGGDFTGIGAIQSTTDQGLVYVSGNTAYEVGTYVVVGIDGNSTAMSPGSISGYYDLTFSLSGGQASVTSGAIYSYYNKTGLTSIGPDSSGNYPVGSSDNGSVNTSSQLLANFNPSYGGGPSMSGLTFLRGPLSIFTARQPPMPLVFLAVITVGLR